MKNLISDCHLLGQGKEFDGKGDGIVLYPQCGNHTHLCMYYPGMYQRKLQFYINLKAKKTETFEIKLPGKNPSFDSVILSL